MSRISSNAAGERRSWPQIYVALALTTLATLLLELSLTRIFSVVFYYHFAFLAISIALFGLGAGGVFSYVVAPRSGQTYSRLGTLAMCTSIFTVISLSILLSQTKLSSWTLALIYFTSAVPFLLAGTVVSLVISDTIERVDRIYFFDLMGAAAGCFCLVPLLQVFGGPNTVLCAAILFAASGAMWFNVGERSGGRAAAVALALALVGLIVVNAQYHVLDVKFAKGHSLAGEQWVRWNSFSRIAVAKDKESGLETIYIDADASTGIANFDFAHLTASERQDLFYQGPGFPYRIRPGAKTLVIGPGGGWDVARALAAGSKDITGVEINPIIATTVMRQQFPEFSRDLYLRPEIRIVVEDGRSFIRRTPEKYQVLQATLVDTWASTAAGAFALSENNLYTSDAFYDYLSHLTDDGILAFTRWGFEPPRESLRLLSLARIALGRLGEAELDRHVMVVREGGAKELAGWGTRDTVLISRKPFSTADVGRAKEALLQSHMQAVYLPGETIPNAFTEFLLTGDPENFYRNYQYDITPVNDNRPFFFYSVQPRDLWSFVRHTRESADYKINRAVPLLFGLMAISIAATAIILILPPLVLGSRLPREPGVRGFLWFFVCIGVGYILIQVALIQKFVLLLGQPTYALTVIVFAMLLSSGLGSYMSRRLIRGSSERLTGALAAVAILVALLAWAAPAVIEAAIGWPLWWKLLVSALVIAPAGFVMGMPFPTGLALLERRHSPSVRWAWALNAASSVLGSATAIFLAIYLGLRETLLVGGLMYLLALVVVYLTRPAPAVEVR